MAVATNIQDVTIVARLRQLRLFYEFQSIRVGYSELGAIRNRKATPRITARTAVGVSARTTRSVVGMAESRGIGC